jgi:hypothetical protein
VLRESGGALAEAAEQRVSDGLCRKPASFDYEGLDDW